MNDKEQSLEDLISILPESHTLSFQVSKFYSINAWRCDCKAFYTYGGAYWEPTIMGCADSKISRTDSMILALQQVLRNMQLHNKEIEENKGEVR